MPGVPLRSGFRSRHVVLVAGIILAVLAGGVEVFNLLRQGPEVQSSDGIEIQARCSVVAGKDLSSHSVRIACGLDKTGIQAVVAQALTGIDIGALVEKARKPRLTTAPQSTALPCVWVSRPIR
jgi:hypothetical protein